MSLDDLSSEFSFAPFWNEIEDSAKYLSQFYTQINELEENNNIYYNTLKDREHNFPSEIINFEMIPNPEKVLSKFKEVVRMGQKDFEFATIWEQRKTVNVLMAGFQNLGEAGVN